MMLMVLIFLLTALLLRLLPKELLHLRLQGLLRLLVVVRIEGSLSASICRAIAGLGPAHGPEQLKGICLTYSPA